MKRKTVTLDDALDTFRDLTATPADGAATRARVLARAAAVPPYQRAATRRALLGTTGLFLVICSSAAVAWTLSDVRWRAPSAVTLQTSEAAVSHGLGSEKPFRTIPAAERAQVNADPLGEDAEQLSYAQAHQVHFFEGAPAKAARLWDSYLKAYPRGRFVPEARFNRALCLIRLSRVDEAAAALRSFANGPAGGYRQRDAAILLEWLAAHRQEPRDNPARSSGP
jgi:TolA-binding protein